MSKTLRDLQFEELFSDAHEEFELDKMAEEVARDVLAEYYRLKKEEEDRP